MTTKSINQMELSELRAQYALYVGKEDHVSRLMLSRINEAIGVREATLPPDPENQNNNRAEWAGLAVKAFQDGTGTDDEDALADLLGDLMHWADRNGRDFAADLERAQRYYSEETTDTTLADTVEPTITNTAAESAAGEMMLSHAVYHLSHHKVVDRGDWLAVLLLTKPAQYVAEVEK